ncbi:TlpA family protein disulfide reductase [Bacillus niameyensis]|uniref:TlpA family protein disulfide reductase n=1 Tax=Bacillus niameyensis TaxID=1522308 RepID=UPI000782F2E4|nr:TlpA disulfide reductase family protein [Bacillus niameyensis]
MKWKVTLLIGIAVFIGVFLYKEYNKEAAYPLPDEDQLNSLINYDNIVLNDNGDNQGEVGLNKGQIPPDIQLQTLSGDLFDLREYKGKTVILNFWATWCPPCRAEMPDMQKLNERYKDDVAVVAVNLTSAEKNKDNIQKFIDEFKIDFTIPLDENGQVGNSFGAYAIPTSYIIDKDGIIQQKIIGPMTYEWMENEVNKLR